MSEEHKESAEEAGTAQGKQNREVAPPRPFPVAAIGASAGGLEAISELLEHLPPDTGIAFVIIQHLSPTHESVLPELLANKTTMPVHKVTNRMRVEPNHVYVIPPNTFMSIMDGHLTLSEREKTSQGGYHSIDFFFSALAPVYQNKAIGIVLSGTASDGTAGLRAIKAEGGITFAQDGTARFQGMPQSAIDSGHVDYILPPRQIARELAALIKIPYAVKKPEELLRGHESELRKIQLLLFNKYGVDFSLYKQTTIQRRILRRMALNRFEHLGDYTRLLLEKSAEVELLYQDLLINVTSFFREPDVFQALGKKVFLAIMKDRKTLDPIRIWIPACSTGEEAYSFAICLFEYLSSKSITTPFQIFATDLDAEAIDKARAGIYPKNVLQSISPQRLKRFFTPTAGGYQVIKALRDTCIFATHNLLKDPPFSRIDLISCQNVLIYIEQNPQKKILQAFHYALKPSGFLLLGRSETIGSSTDLFAQVEQDLKIYKKKEAETTLNFDFTARPVPGIIDIDFDRGRPALEPPEVDVEKEADKLLLARYVPGSVLVNKDLHIIRFHGDTHKYLHPAAGKASFHLMKMVRDELILELRGLIQRARKDGQTVKKEGIPFIVYDQVHEVNLEVVPIKAPAKEPCFLVLFRETYDIKPVQVPATARQKTRKDAKDRRIEILELELREAREQMKSMSEEFEATREELQSANEEVLSSNEELQSINEEIETSKEEMQSTNEELITINEELYQRNIELKEAGEYREAIVETIREPLVVLTSDLRIKTANRAFYADFRVSAKETEGNFFFEIGNRQWDIPGLRKQLTEIIARNKSFDDFEVTHVFSHIGEKTLLISAMRMGQEGDRKNKILLVIEDITDRKRAEEALLRSHRLNTTILNSIHDIFVSVDNHWNLMYINKRAEEFLGKGSPNLLGKNLWEALPDYLGTEFHDRLLEAMQTKTSVEFEYFDERLNEWLLYRIYPSEETLSIYSTNITEKKHSLEQIKKSQERYQNFISRSTEGIWRFEILKPIDTELPVPEQVDALFRHATLEECNDAIATMHGYAGASEVIGLRMETLLPRTSGHLAFMEAFVRSGYCLSDAETREIDRYGQPRYSLHNIVGFVEDGTLKRIWGTQRDITRQKLAEIALQGTQAKLKLALMAGNVGVWLWNIKSNEVRWAKDAHADYDLGEGAFSGTFEDWLAFVHPDDRAQVQQSIRKAVTNRQDLKLEFRLLLPDNSVRWILFQTHTSYDQQEQPEQMMGVNMDISDRKMLERQKDEFIGIASHELKTPVTSIKAYAELLYQMLMDADDVATAALVQKMDSQIDRLTKLIKDLLDVTRITEGQLQLQKEAIDLNELVQEVAEDLQRTTDKHTLVSKLQPVPLLQADRDRIGQVLINFISNAIKYSPDANEVVISTQAEPDRVTVCVQDFGIGMSDEAQQKVFDRFYRVKEAANRTFPGIGLGLFIASEIVKRHGGTTWVDSEPHKGSRFYFTIPIGVPDRNVPDGAV
ncbi:chemotaxis protein CheB [Telluribacter sp. SYSU D00476]|uniref:chemotaxis protein CheB n=1 Tax=Telluribacter sp. SYSU D00476 TaxID=2811430 RepID=UPI001FF49874|nr:chemotaxis protein CheB [Telluribacter sp. SYSU D00476]